MEEIKTDSTPFIAAALTGLLARSESDIGDRHKLTFYGEQIVSQAIMIGNIVANRARQVKFRNDYPADPTRRVDNYNMGS